jgi:hypothetical protein
MSSAVVRKHAFYPSWDITLPELPPRSRLYHLAPIGVGTRDVENLTSFIMRLAEAHCVVTNDLFTHEIAPLFNCPYLFKSETEPISLASHQVYHTQQMNGVGSAIPRCVSALESLTCQSDLHLLTMLPWRNLLTQQSLMRKTRAWCPDCYADSKNQCETVYEKLIWTLIPVSVCIRHQRLLEDSCPFCGQSSPVLKYRSRPGHCFRCERWLGSDNRAKTRGADQSDEDLAQQIEKAKIVGEMFILSADLSPSLSPRDFLDLLNRYARQVTAGNMAAFARFLGFDSLKLDVLRHDVNSRPTLDVFITLIQRLGLPVKDFLDGKESEIELPDRREVRLPPSISLAREMMQAAVTDPACPSLSEVAARIGYKDKDSLRQANRELYKEISARNRQVRVCDPQARRRHYDNQTLKEKLAAALQENPAPPLSQIAESLGYKQQARLKARCPDLYRALMERRQAYLKECRESLEKALKAALTEEPPPSLRTVTLRVGVKSQCAIDYHFPELARAIIDRAREYQEKCKERAKLALESALIEVPPPSVPQVARNTNQSLTRLQSNFPDLCRQVTANHAEYRHQRSIARKEGNRSPK